MIFCLKRGDSFLLELIIFLLLNLAFFSAAFIAVYRVSEDIKFYEQVYAKKIGVLLDSARPGTIISINIANLQKIIDKNDLDVENIFTINSGKVYITLTKNGEGYGFSILNNYEVEKSFYKNSNGDLVLRIFVKDIKNE